MRRLLLTVTLLFVSFAVVAGVYPLHPTKYLDFNGLNIAVYDTGGYKGPGMLLIHGNTASANHYAKFFRTKYAKNHRIVAVDLPGYGNSDDSLFYDTALFADAITFVAESLGLDDGILVGWSLGGDLALQASTQLPFLKGIFTFGTAPIGFAPELPPPLLSPEESPAGPAAVYGFIPDLTDQQIFDFVEAFFRPDFHLIPGFLFKDGLRADPLTRLAVAVAASGGDPTFQDEVVIARNLTIPLSLIVGEEESFVRLEYLEALAPSLPTLFGGRALLIPGTGHAIQWERTKLFEIYLRIFVESIVE